MRRRRTGRAFDWGATVLVLAVIVAITWRHRVPVGVPIDIALVTGAMLWETHYNRAAARAKGAATARSTPTYLDGGREATEHIGDADRDAVLSRLGDRLASGHLTVAEFNERATEATRARTRGQLTHTLRDLP